MKKKKYAELSPCVNIKTLSCFSEIICLLLLQLFWGLALLLGVSSGCQIRSFQYFLHLLLVCWWGRLEAIVDWVMSTKCKFKDRKCIQENRITTVGVVLKTKPGTGNENRFLHIHSYTRTLSSTFCWLDLGPASPLTHLFIDENMMLRSRMIIIALVNIIQPEHFIPLKLSKTICLSQSLA